MRLYLQRILFLNCTGTSCQRRIHSINEDTGASSRLKKASRHASKKDLKKQNLSKNDDLFHLALSASNAGAWSWNIKTNDVQWSNENFSLLGYIPEECEASYENWFRRVHPADQAYANQEIQKAVNGKTNLNIEFRVIWPDGTIHWMNDLGNMMLGKNEEPLGMYGIQIDITERKRVEDVLRDSQDRLAMAVEAGGVGIWDWRPQSDELYWDDRMYALYGVEREGLSVAYDVWAKRVHKDDLARIEGEIQAALSNQRPFDTEFRIIPLDGEIRHIKSFGRVFHDEKGYAQRLLGTNWDITERKRADIRQVDLARMVDASLNEIYLFDERSLYFIEVNRSARENLGYTMKELKNMTPIDIKPLLNRESFLSRIKALRDGREEQIVFETLHQRKNATTYWVEVHLQKSTYAGSPVFNAIVLDISKRKRAEESMAMAVSIYQSSQEALMVTDANNIILDINPAFTKMTGYTSEDVLGKNAIILQSGRQNLSFYKNIWKAVLSTGHWQGEVWDRRKDGTSYPAWLNLSLIRHSDDNPYRIISQFSDISAKKQQDDLIWTQANYDALTNLPNRRLLIDRLNQEIKKVSRNDSKLALLFIDLDHFKEINDSLGHAKGDMMLIEAAKRINACVRQSDTIARLGGDEFTAIIPDYINRRQIERIAQQMIDALSQPFYFEGDDNGYFISASIGITLYPDDARNFEELLKNADQAMYQAKAQGRQRFNYFAKATQVKAQEKLILTRDLRYALIRKELEVYYQPIINLKTGDIVKSEALLRWHHPRLGMVSPDVFILLAEESGLIHEIGEWVFSQVIVNIKRWLALTDRIVPVCVNQSPLQFAYRTKKVTWIDTLSQLDLPGHSITVEITEGSLLKDSPVTKQHLMDFRDSGIEVSIDDFGTGFSALSYLREFDIDYLKIDRSFTCKLTEDESDRVLTEAIIVMAHKLGIKTIAEGVETTAQRDLLISFDCDYVQGFLYSPAVSLEKFEEMLVG